VRARGKSPSDEPFLEHSEPYRADFLSLDFFLSDAFKPCVQAVRSRDARASLVVIEDTQIPLQYRCAQSPNGDAIT
jgi:hypothetical protein